jgi:threonyl-tRNA synthetase
MAYLIEETMGAFPTWLAPVQVKIIPIADRHQPYANEVCKKLEECGIRVEVDERSEKVGYKIREAQMEKVPFMLVTGDKEQEDGTVSVRVRKDGDKGSMTIPDFISLIKEHIDTKMID